MIINCKMFLAVVLLGITQLQVVITAATDSYTKREIKYSSTKLTWSGAWSTCVQNTGHLISINDHYTINALLYMFNLAETDSMTGPIWTGLHNVVSGSNPEFQWANCDPMGNFSTLLEDNTGKSEDGRCVVAGQVSTHLRTKLCNNTFVFACEEDKGACSYNKNADKMCTLADPSSREILEGEFDDKNCKARCTQDTRNSEVCWAYERDRKTKVCTLIFGSDPYMCETQENKKETEVATRECFTFSDITGNKEQTIDSLDPVSDCVKTTVSPTTTTALTSTTAAATTTAASESLATTITGSTDVASGTSSSAAATATAISESLGTTTASSTIATGITTIAVPATTTAATTTTDPATTSTQTVSLTSDVVTTDISNVGGIASTATATTVVIPTPTISATTGSIAGNESGLEITQGSKTSENPTTSLSVLSSTLAPAVTSPGRAVFMKCIGVKSYTPAQRRKRTKNMVEDLTLDRKGLSSYIRTKSSANDKRVSARDVGGVGIALLVIAALLIIVPDCITLGLKLSRISTKKI